MNHLKFMVIFYESCLNNLWGNLSIILIDSGHGTVPLAQRKAWSQDEENGRITWNTYCLYISMDQPNAVYYMLFKY